LRNPSSCSREFDGFRFALPILRATFAAAIRSCLLISMSDDVRLHLYQTLQEGQEKYTYFLLAAAGAAIGFAITQTQNTTLAYSQTPLALAVLCWGLSFVYGCRSIWATQNVIQQNYEMLRTKAGLHPVLPPDPEFLKWIANRIEEQSKTSGRPSRWQYKFLIAGAVFYIAWHILEMYLRTVAPPGHH
jgi:hypothetical protein